MKYVSLTFDDGREDNYSVAFPVLNQNGFAATLYCTTGFIDGTWQKKEDWYSAERGIAIDSLRDLQAHGWEIALHGDRHITEAADTKKAIQKLTAWGLYHGGAGMSLPDSREGGAQEVIEQFYPETVAYVRGGRKRSTRRFSSKILFGLYTFLGVQSAYNAFNRPNVVDLETKADLTFVPSVVIRLEDRPKMILNFIESLPDEVWVSLMLHSVHPDDKIYANDPWNWQESKFKALCSGLANMQEAGAASVLPMIEVVNRINRGR